MSLTARPAHLVLLAKGDLREAEWRVLAKSTNYTFRRDLGPNALESLAHAQDGGDEKRLHLTSS
jgi:hypothetical protein